MPALRIVLLVVGVVGMLRHGRAPVWSVPATAVVVALVFGATSVDDALVALHPLAEPLAFLLAAVPLALLLDRTGFFTATAGHIGHRRHLHLWLWLFAAAVTTVLNLDAAVVLLTPLYVRIARRHGLDPIAAAFPPVLLASLASSLLPVSNLTNLIAAERNGLHTRDFLTSLGPASVAAIVVGYLAYRRVFWLLPVSAGESEEIDDRALVRGVPVVAFVLLGFTLGDLVGVAPWSVALVADLALIAMTRTVPWRDLPVSAAALAAALGVLAASAAPHLHLGRVLDGAGAGGDLRVLMLAVLGANAVNNLPAVLVGLPALGPEPGTRVWALLAGVNMGPVLLVTGSLAGLLWLDTVRRLDVDVDARRYTTVGIRVGGPAILAAATALVLTRGLAS